MNNKKYKNKNKLLIPLIMIFITILTSILTLSFSVFLIQFVFLSITIPLLMKKDFEVLKIYTIIFGLSFLFLFLIYNANLMKYDSAYYGGGSDDLMFETSGKLLYESRIFNPEKIIDSGIIPSLFNSSAYSIYIALLIGFSNFFDGYSIFLPLISNIYFLLWATMLFEYFLKKYAKFDNLKIKITILIFAITPNIQYINGHIFRDTLVVLEFFLIIYLFDRIVSRINIFKIILYILMLLILMYVTYYTRSQALIFAAAICLITFGEKFKIKKIYLVLTVMPLLVFKDFIDKINLGNYIENYSDYVVKLAGDGLSSIVFGQPILPIGIFLRAFYALITPFPNIFILFKDVNNLLYDITFLLVYIGVILQIIGIPFLLKRVIKFDWLSICFLTCFIAVIITTFTFRHVLIYYPFMVALTVDGFLKTPPKTRIRIFYCSLFIGMALAMIYLLIKIL